MKTGIVAIITGLCISAPLLAQESEKPKTPQGTKIAVVNVGGVFNGYGRCVTTNALWDPEYRGYLESVGPFKEKTKKLTDEANGWEDALRHGEVAEKDKVRYEDAIKQNRLELDELNIQINKAHGGYQERKLAALWKDIKLGVAAVARANGYQIVLGYAEPVDKELLTQFPNINRKKEAMDIGATVPLYIHGSVDITDLVIRHLNSQRQPQLDEKK